MHVNLQNAEQVIEAARKKAVELKTKMCIAVVDSGANLKAFVRMDDAWVGSIDIAIKKGLPIVDEDGVLVGAIGVSGSSVENDHGVAAAGVDVLGVSELPEHPWRT
jgi:uncharacterized protein GlcG (DUF336 family)